MNKGLLAIFILAIFPVSRTWANECRAIFSIPPKAARGIEILHRPLPSVKKGITVQSYIELLYSDALQSHSAQKAFEAALNQLKSDGYMANVQIIERLGLLNSPQTDHKITFSSLIESIRLILSEQLQSAKKLGQIPADTLDAIKIGIIFHKEANFDRNNPDHWISLEPHELIPEGFKLYDGSTLLPGSALWSSLARGHFPALFVLNTSGNFVVSSISLPHELLGHVPTYLMNVDYALSYMKVAQTIMQKYRQYSAEKGKPFWSFIYNTGLFSRVYVFNEGLTKSRTDVILSHSELFGLADSSEIPPVGSLTFNSLIPQSTDLAELSSTLKQLIELTPKVSIPVGGASVVSTVHSNPHSNYIDYLAKVVYPRILAWQKKVPQEAQVRLLSKMIGIIRGYHLTMSHMNFDELATEIFRDAPSLSSPMSYYFGEQAGYFSATREIVALVGPLNHIAYFEPGYFLYSFSATGWNHPVKFPLVKAR